jgi:2-amino-4-hydroxy-6-hydroxymethyldihydropteridine diphosphokinase
MTQRNFEALLALGGNLPWNGQDPLNIQQDALSLLRSKGLTVKSVSRFHATPCFPAGAGPDYVNAAAVLETALAPAELLDVLHEVEAHFGRTRERRWGGRTLDLDLIAAGDLVLPDLVGWTHWHDLPANRQASDAPKTLILPHPRLQDRAFVLIPLLDIAPDWRHPVTGKTVAQMVQSLPQAEIDAVRPL